MPIVTVAPETGALLALLLTTVPVKTPLTPPALVDVAVAVGFGKGVLLAAAVAPLAGAVVALPTGGVGLVVPPPPPPQAANVAMTRIAIESVW